MSQHEPRPSDPLAVALPAFCAGLTFLFGAALFRHPLGAAVLVPACLGYAALVGVVAYLRNWQPGRLALIVVLANAALATYVTLHSGVSVDVAVFLRDASKALLEGRNPYTLTFPNLYSAQDTARFYGPGVVVGDRVTYGFPYLPATLLWPLGAVALGDVRLAGMAAVAVLCVAMIVAKPTRRARVIGMALACAPSTLIVIVGGWTETTLIATLGLAVVAAHRRWFLLAAALLGLLLASKQYFVVTIPCLYLLRDYATRARLATMAGAALAVTMPFAIADFEAFRKAVIDYQFIQPFRSDSASLLVWTVNQFGWPSANVYSVLPLGFGLLAALLLAWKSPPGIATFCAATALSLLAVILLSKQAFLNYYYFVGGALLIAAWAAGHSTPQSMTGLQPEGPPSRNLLEEKDVVSVGSDI